MTAMLDDKNVYAYKLIIHPWRNGYKWNVNECLRLEREFDLLQLSVPEIAKLHNRTINAIMFKLEVEGLDTYNNLYHKTFGTEQSLEEKEKEEELDDTDDELVLVKDLVEESDDDDDDYVDLGNQNYILKQMTNMQNQINTIMSYFSKTSTSISY